MLPRPAKRWMMIFGDGALCVLAVWCAYYLRLGEWRFLTEDVLKLILGAMIFWYPAALITGVYRQIFRYAGAGAMLSLARAIAIMLVPMIAVFLIAYVPGVPRTLSVLQPIVFFLFLTLSRIMLRYFLLDFAADRLNSNDIRRILIYGAGGAGQRLAASIRHQPGLEFIGFVDDDPGKVGHRLDHKFISSSRHLDDIVLSKQITDVYLAMPGISRTKRKRIVEQLSEMPVQVLILPEMRDIIEGDVTINDLREVEIGDLLGRRPVAPDKALLAQTITGKTVLVTGAGGSIGSELCRQIAGLSPAKLVLVEMSEFALYAIEAEIRNKYNLSEASFELVAELGNVADRLSIARIMASHAPDTVFHAAAYKHVPIVEANIVGGVRNNVFGTRNTVEAAVAAGVANFILISTDKAVRPTNIMGATKRICEQILQAIAANPERAGRTRFSMVRFGNVLGSSGSVVPLFRRQIREGGPITITDRRITRYFMTIPEAAELVIQAGAMAEGGEVFVLDMGKSVKIIDLAETMVRLSGLRIRDAENPEGDIEIVEIGLRPGEKLYEELLIGEDPQATSHERIVRARESHFPLEYLESRLDELEKLINDGDKHKVRELVVELVPEFRASEADKQPVSIAH